MVKYAKTERDVLTYANHPFIVGMKFPRVIITPSQKSTITTAEKQNLINPIQRAENQDLANSRINNTNTTNESYSNEKPGSNGEKLLDIKKLIGIYKKVKSSVSYFSAKDSSVQYEDLL